jgi:hypothetical protein
MVSKVLAAVFAVAVLSVGGYTYWYSEYGGEGNCSKCLSNQRPVAATPEAVLAVPPCCQEPSRTGAITLDAGESCCADTAKAPGTTEVLTIQPHEVK